MMTLAPLIVQCMPVRFVSGSDHTPSRFRPSRSSGWTKKPEHKHIVSTYCTQAVIALLLFSAKINNL